MDKVTVKTIVEMKRKKEKITSLTAYDYFMAKFLDIAGIDIILVGDSVSMVVLGKENTLSVSMEYMLTITEAVARARKRALVVADMPFGSYQVSVADAVRNAMAFLRVGAEAVKIEGGLEFAETVKKLVESGIPVMGHIGMLPQSVNLYGGYLVQGTDEKSKEYLIQSAIALEQAGAFSIVIEKVKSSVAADITDKLKIPTIGIGAGPYCDGQILVLNDMLGLFDLFKPKFVRKYSNLKEEIISSVKRYIEDVKSQSFPTKEESFE